MVLAFARCMKDFESMVSIVGPSLDVELFIAEPNANELKQRT